MGISGAILLGGLSGCIFSPKKGDPAPPRPPVYPVLSTPQAVLKALILAYNARDSVEYRKLLYAGYQGGSYNVDGLGGSGTFSRDDEIRHIQHLAQDLTIADVSLDLGSDGAWVRTSGVGPKGEQWAEIDISNPKLSIYYTNAEPWGVIPNENFLFQFAPEVNSSSPTDTLWTIGYWFEQAPP